MIKFNKQLLINSANELGLNNEVNESNEFLIDLFNHAQNWINSSDTKRLPCCPPPEKHPYLDLYQINPEFKKYIIGTFPPITYQSDLFTDIKFCNGKIVQKPQLPFYHGNRQMLWQYLMSEQEYCLVSEDRFQRRIQIINFLNEKRINYTDLISYCQRAEYNADDKNLFNIILNEELLEIATRESDKDILLVFNTSSLFTSRGLKFNSNGNLNAASFVFDMFISLMFDAGIEVRIQFLNEQPIMVNYANKRLLAGYSNIIRFNIYLNGKRFKVVAGPSPANGDGQLHNNIIYRRFKRIFHEDDNLSIGEIKKRFKHYVYHTALLGNCDDLYHLNYD
jgi:hypothetical protein